MYELGTVVCADKNVLDFRGFRFGMKTQSVYLAAEEIYIDNDTFNSAYELYSFSLNANNTINITNEIAKNCTYLQEVTLGMPISFIQSNTFESHTGLKTVNLKNTRLNWLMQDDTLLILPTVQTISLLHSGLRFMSERTWDAPNALTLDINSDDDAKLLSREVIASLPGLVYVETPCQDCDYLDFWGSIRYAIDQSIATSCYNDYNNCFPMKNHASSPRTLWRWW